MSNSLRKLRRRIDPAAAHNPCYLCGCEWLTVEQLKQAIITGPGRVLYRFADTICKAHDRQKEQRRDVREDRLFKAGWLVRFSDVDEHGRFVEGAVMRKPDDYPFDVPLMQVPPDVLMRAAQAEQAADEATQAAALDYDTVGV